MIPSAASRKHAILYGTAAYRANNMIERALCSLKHYRRIATRCDKLARNFLSADAVAAIILWWT